MKDGELDPAYITKREELKELVTSIIRPKIVHGKPLSGKEFVSFLEQVTFCNRQWFWITDHLIFFKKWNKYPAKDGNESLSENG